MDVLEHSYLMYLESYGIKTIAIPNMINTVACPLLFPLLFVISVIVISIIFVTPDVLYLFYYSYIFKYVG